MIVKYVYDTFLLLVYLLVPTGWIFPWPNYDGSTSGDLKFASYYADHMVLQRKPASARVWGYSYNSLDNVDVILQGAGLKETYTTLAHIGPEGKAVWSVELYPKEAGGPYTIYVIFNNCSINITDVLFGDVWICSGQSNMQFTLSEMNNSKEEIDNVGKFPDVRVFQNALKYSSSPLEDLRGISMQWQRPNPKTIDKFSAVCWLYGKHLYEKYKRPVGLVESCWGGTRVEAWSSADALKVCFPDGPTKETKNNAASVLYNAMIHPFTSMAIYGSIWYQGEANQYDYPLYGCAIQQMVKQWRKLWFSRNPSMEKIFPFGEVQLAPNFLNDKTRNFSGVRWSQSHGFGYAPNPSLDRFFMAVAIDLPDFNSPHGAVHGRYKRPVAYRLALAGFAVAYNDTSEGAWQGPIPTHYDFSSNNELVITMSNGTDTIEIRDMVNSTHFEVCCSANRAAKCAPDIDDNDKEKWMKTTYVRSQTAQAKVVVSAPCERGNIIAIRYLWRMSPCVELYQCPIYGKENALPAPPFYQNIVRKLDQTISPL